jgi:hypothetical protein
VRPRPLPARRPLPVPTATRTPKSVCAAAPDFSAAAGTPTVAGRFRRSTTTRCSRG